MLFQSFLTHVKPFLENASLGTRSHLCPDKPRQAHMTKWTAVWNVKELCVLCACVCGCEREREVVVMHPILLHSSQTVQFFFPCFPHFAGNRMMMIIPKVMIRNDPAINVIFTVLYHHHQHLQHHQTTTPTATTIATTTSSVPCFLSWGKFLFTHNSFS